MVRGNGNPDEEYTEEEIAAELAGITFE